MRLINADALLEEANSDGAYGYVDTKQIADAPTIDAVPVVRCRECIHRTKHGNCGHPRHEDTLPTAYPNDFCSYGERKEGDDNGC